MLPLLVGIACTVLVALAVSARWLERRISFFPTPGEKDTPLTYGVPYEAFTVATADGEALRAWRIEALTPRARILYFHGNAGNLSNWAPVLTTIVRRGYSVIAVDYRGYGLSSGRPTERGILRDADAFVRATRSDSGNPMPTIFWGRSLGTAIAAYAATVVNADALILESGFSDARAVVRNSWILTLLSLFATYRFQTAEYVNQARVPVLQLHGSRDHVIPLALGRELFNRIEVPKEFVVIADAAHNDPAPLESTPYWEAIERLVDGGPPRAVRE